MQDNAIAALTISIFSFRFFVSKKNQIPINVEKKDLFFVFGVFDKKL